MSFAWTGWGVLRPWSTGFTIWKYRSDDPICEIVIEGYFDSVKALTAVQPEDWIIGFAGFEVPIELVICRLDPHVAVEDLHSWFERECGSHPIH